MQALAQVNEVKDIFLEARTTETNASLEEFRPDAGVVANGVRNFVDIGACRFTNGRQGIDRRNALGEHGIRRKF
jgi:hypothetical protein